MDMDRTYFQPSNSDCCLSDGQPWFVGGVYLCGVLQLDPSRALSSSVVDDFRGGIICNYTASMCSRWCGGALTKTARSFFIKESDRLFGLLEAWEQSAY